MKKILKIISKAVLSIWGWEIVGTFPKFSKAIIIVAPHRKGFQDVLLGWLVQNVHTIPNKKFLVKYEALQIPIVGWILKKLGGIGIDRKREISNLPKGYYIGEMVKFLNQEKTVTLVITPEGTRTPGTPWKKGFYDIALLANIPITMVAFDYDRKRVAIYPELFTAHPEHDRESQKQFIKLWYELETSGKYIPILP